MITLREFLKMTRNEQYRVYQPNRDCLIFESYFTIHSPYTFNYKSGDFKLKDEYWDNNDYCRGVYLKGHADPAYDTETAEFLDHFGDYEVFSIECSSFSPMKMFKGSDGEIKFERIQEPQLVSRDVIPCLNIFIAPYDEDHSWECSHCAHRLIKTMTTFESVPDPKDKECKSCWRFILNRPTGDRDLPKRTLKQKMKGK